MTPTRKIVSLVPMNEIFLALCEDGSVWRFDPSAEKVNDMFRLITELDVSKYI